MKITWFGAASLLIESEKDSIMIDPAKGPAHSENSPSWEDLMCSENILLASGRIERSAGIPLIVNTSGATVYCSAVTASLLEAKRTYPDLIAVVKPGLCLSFGTIHASILAGCTSSSDYRDNIKGSLRSPRSLRYLSNSIYLASHIGGYADASAVLCCSISAAGRTVLIPGLSMLNPDTDYPKYPDMLVLPYTGSDDDNNIVSAIERIEPRSVMLDMFDDFYPPVTKTADTRGLHKLLSDKFPDLRVIKPKPGKTITLL